MFKIDKSCGNDFISIIKFLERECEMDLNQIKLLTKEELLQKLKQSGFENVAKILMDKDIDGQRFLDIKEFEIFKWRLNLSEKKSLWNCIREVKEKPGIFMIKPKTLNRTPIIVNTSDSGKEFKEKLQCVLGATGSSIGSASTLLKSANVKALQPNLNRPLRKKPLPPPPPPPLSNGFIRNKSFSRNLDPITSCTNKLFQPPLPISDDVITYKNISRSMDLINKSSNNKPLPQLPPTGDEIRSKSFSRKTTKEIDDLVPPGDYVQMLPPNEVDVDDYLTPSDVSSHPVLLPKKGNPGKVDSKTKDKKPLPHDEIILRNTKAVDRNAFALPPVAKRNNFPTDDDDSVSYELSPSAENINRNRAGEKILHDIGQEDNVEYEESPNTEGLRQRVFSFFFNRNKKHMYENHVIKGEKMKYWEIPTNTTRPLPDLPTSPLPMPRQTSLLSKPFPPPRPRDVSQDSDDGPANYVELVPEFATEQKSSNFTQGLNAEPDEPPIYGNTHTAQHSAEEIQEIYENTPKLLRVPNPHEVEEIYENTEAIQAEHTPNSTMRFRKTTFPEDKISNKNNASIWSSKYNETPFDNQQPIIAQDLTAALRKELEERRFKLQNQEKNLEGVKIQSEENLTDSDIDLESDEFDDDLASPIYGNVQTEDETNEILPPIPVRDNDSSLIEEKKIPIHKRALPDVPTNNISPSTSIKGSASLKDKITTSPKEDQNINSRHRGLLQPVAYPNYEHQNIKQLRGNINQSETSQLKNSSKNDVDSIFDLNEEPFYRNTDRRGAKIILSKLENGAFLFRPSRNFFLVLTVKHNSRIYNFGIERSLNNMLRLNTEGNMEAPEFCTLREFVTHFSIEPLTFESEDEVTEIYLKTVLLPSL